MSVFKDSVYKSVGEYPPTYEDKKKYLEKKTSLVFRRRYRLEVILISYQGEKKSIKVVEEGAHALRQFIRSLQNRQHIKLNKMWSQTRVKN